MFFHGSRGVEHSHSMSTCGFSAIQHINRLQPQPGCLLLVHLSRQFLSHLVYIFRDETDTKNILSSLKKKNRAVNKASIELFPLLEGRLTRKCMKDFGKHPDCDF